MKRAKSTVNHNASSEIIIANLFSVSLKANVLEHKDIYSMLNKKFHDIFSKRNIVDFSSVREEIEQKHPEYNIDDIYSQLHDELKIGKKSLEQIKRFELNLVKKVYKKRISFFSKYSDKKIIYYVDKRYKPSLIDELINENELIQSDEILFSYNFENISSMFNFVKSKYGSIEYITANYDEVLQSEKNDIKGVFYPKSTDIFMGYINECNVNRLGLINKKFNSDFIDLEKYTEISGVRTSIAVVANKLCDDSNFNINNDFNSSTDIIGYYAFGMHLLALVSFINSIRNKRKIVFMGRDGYIPKKAFNIIYPNAQTDYLEISRLAYLPVLFTCKEDFNFLKKYINIKYVSEKDIIDILKPILTLTNDVFSDKIFENENEYNIFVEKIKKLYSKHKYKEYKTIFIKYLKNHLNKKSIIFDIGYSGFPEYLINSLCGFDCDACFIHTNNSTCFNNSIYNRTFKVYTFYDFKPKYSGTLREILISDLNPSCVGYKKVKGRISPIYGKNILDYKSKEIINNIQTNALLFIKDYFNIFEEIIDLIDFNKTYMSLPFEYFMHKTNIDETKAIFGSNFVFDVNLNEEINLIDDWNRQKERNNL